MDDLENLSQPLSPREALKELRSLEASAKKLKQTRPKKNDHLKLIAILFIPILFVLCAVVAYSKREVLARKVLDEAPKEPAVKEILDPRVQKVIDDFDQANALLNDGRALLLIGGEEGKLKIARASVAFESISALQLTFKTKNLNFEDMRAQCKESIALCQSLLIGSAPKSIDPPKVTVVKPASELEALQAKLNALEQESNYNSKVQEVKQRIALLERQKVQEQIEAERKNNELQMAEDQRKMAILAESERQATEKINRAAQAKSEQQQAIQKIDHKNVNRLKDIDLYYNSPELLKYALQFKLETEKTLIDYKTQLQNNVIRFEPILNRLNHEIETTEQEITAAQQRIEEIIASGRKPEKSLYDNVSNLEARQITLLNDRRENTTKQEIFKGGVFEREVQLLECRRIIKYINYRLEAPKSEPLTILSDQISNLENEHLYYSLCLYANSFLVAKTEADMAEVKERIRGLTIEDNNVEIVLERKRYAALEAKLKEVKQLAVKKDFVRGHIESLEKQIEKNKRDLDRIISEK